MKSYMRSLAEWAEGETAKEQAAAKAIRRRGRREALIGLVPGTCCPTCACIVPVPATVPPSYVAPAHDVPPALESVEVLAELAAANETTLAIPDAPPPPPIPRRRAARLPREAYRQARAARQGVEPDRLAAFDAVWRSLFPTGRATLEEKFAEWCEAHADELASIQAEYMEKQSRKLLREQARYERAERESIEGEPLPC